jgi:hypothetical protein
MNIANTGSCVIPSWIEFSAHVPLPGYPIKTYTLNLTPGQNQPLYFDVPKISQPTSLHAGINCSSIDIIPISITNVPLNISIVSNTLNRLKYYVYRDNQSLYNLTTNQTFHINITSLEPEPYYYEVYTPGNNNYTCSEWLVFVSNG